jgi:predicted secreted protein
MIGNLESVRREMRARAGRLTVGFLLAASGFAAVGTGATWVTSTAGAAVTPQNTICVAPSLSSPKTVPYIVWGPDGWPTRSVVLKNGSLLEVHLCESAESTGYSWSATKVPDFLVLKGSKVRPLPGEVGAGQLNDHVFTFQVMKLGTDKVSFELRRPQTIVSSPAEKTLVLSVIVRD